jgi:predicted Zn-dependent protease
MTHRVNHWAARIVLPVLLLLVSGVFPLFRATGQNTLTPETPPISLLNDNLVQNRPLQALYQAEARAAVLGWSPELLTSAGSIWYANGDPWLAADYWWAAAQAAPGRAAIIRRLAETLLEIQRWPEASDALNHLLTLLPTDYWAHYQLGLLLVASNPAAARQHLAIAGEEGAYQDTVTTLLSLLPASADAAGAMRVGAALAERELWAYAEIAFSFAAAARQDYPEALAYTGLARDKQGKDGSPQIAAALRLGADNPQVLYLYGLHLRTVGDYLSSQDILLQAATLEPENPAFAAETGTAYRLNGNLEQAEAWLKIAVRLSGNEPAFTELLSQFYAASGIAAEDGTSLP